MRLSITDNLLFPISFLIVFPLFCDSSYDVLINGQEEEIVSVYEQFNENIVFSSEKYCWPDQSLASKYPKSDGHRYLNSGMFIGNAKSILELVSQGDIADDDDDQLYYTKIYLDDVLRKQIGIKLDLTSLLMQNLNGAVNDVEIQFSQDKEFVLSKAKTTLKNLKTNTEPLIIHGNGASKLPLNSIGNYLPKAWHPVVGCLSCDENLIDFLTLQEEDYPTVLIAANILKPTPFLTEYLEDILVHDYPKSKIYLYIQSTTDYHEKLLQEFLDKFKNDYSKLVIEIHDDGITEDKLRNRYL